MSYIRSGSNPEKLYIVGTGNHVEIMEGSKDVWYIPYNVFEGLIRKYHRMFHECPCEFKGAKLDEVWVDKDNIEKDESLYIPNPNYLLDCKIRLTYGENKVYMWDVTWEYIVNGYIEKYERFIKPKKVYLTYDPLYERIVCVHEKPNMTCKKCKDGGYKHTDNNTRSLYTYEEQPFTIVTEDKLEKQ